jgi:hypothetical protein
MRKNWIVVTRPSLRFMAKNAINRIHRKVRTKWYAGNNPLGQLVASQIGSANPDRKHQV